MTDSNPLSPRAGEVWIAYLDSTVGHEQRGNRPVVVISADWFNDATGGTLVMTVPLTTMKKPYLTRVPTNAPEANLVRESWAMCEQAQALSFDRFKRKRGTLPGATLEEIRVMVTRILHDTYPSP